MLRSALIGVALGAALAFGGAAAAQSYQILQAGKRLGTFEIGLTRGVAGTVSDSTLSLNGLADLTDHLVTDGSGHALSYRLQGTARATSLTMNVTIDGRRAAFTIDQGGTKQALDVPLPGPVVILDNSMLDGWQIVASRLDAGGTSPQRFDVLVPQAALTGTVTFAAKGSESVTVGGSAVKTERFDAMLDVGGQKVGLSLWLDGAGRIVAFAQPSAALRYELETPASKAAASAAAASAQVARVALEKRLANERRCITEQTVQVRSTGEALAGTLSVPVGAGASGRGAPALLLLPGSGAVDRNGNAPPLITNAIYQQLAYALGCQGYAVLRIDKLGIGASTGDANAVTLQTYAQNAADWVAFLRSRNGIDPGRIGLMGHSEGGLVALYVAAEGYAHPTVVVLLESPGVPLGQLIVNQMVREARLRGTPEAEILSTEAQVRQAVKAIEASHGTRLALTGALANNAVAASFAHAAGLLRSEFVQDPAALAAKITAPVLVVQGGKDVQVGPRNGEALAHAAPHATYLFFPNMEHDLYETSGKAIDDALPGPATLLSSSLLDALRAYLAGFLLAAD